MAEPNPIQRISRGLDEHGRPGAGLTLADFENIIPVGSKQSSEAMLKELADSSRRRLAKLGELSDLVDRHVAKAEQQAREQADELRGTLDRSQRQAMVRKARDRARREALEAHKEERDRLTGELRNAAKQAPAWLETLGSPALYLSMKTLESRQGYMSALAHAGPAELKGALFNSIASGNAKLAAAALAVADAQQIKVNDLVGASRDQVAARLCPEHAELVEAVTTLQHSADDADYVVREMESGQSDATRRIARGVRDKPTGEGEGGEGDNVA
jgi:hypothetical protein